MLNIENIIEKTEQLTLLYVEDNKDTRDSIFLMFENIFKNIIIAVDGKDGLEKYKNNKIDLVIADINMPVMNGLDMCQYIKEINPDQPIILLTALTEIKTIKRAIDIGINSFINKPLTDINILFLKIGQIFKKMKYDETEKVQLVYKMIHDISHHWKQPLSIISTISSGYSFKVEHDMEITKNDLKNIDIITKKTHELSDILNKIENIDFDTVTIQDIEKIIKISNPIYEDKL